MIKQFKIDLLVFVQTKYEKEPTNKKEISDCISTGIDYLKGGSKSPFNSADAIASTTPMFLSKDVQVYWCCINLVYGWHNFLENATKKVEALWGKQFDQFLLDYNKKEELTDDQKLAYEYEHEEEMIMQHHYATNR